MRRAILVLAIACAGGCGPRAVQMNLLGRVAVLDDGEAPKLDAPAPKETRWPDFFRRVSRAVSAAWHPDVAYLRHEPTPPNGRRSIVVRVELQPTGALKDLTLLASSGSGYLDEDALASLRRAAPFKRPPQALADVDGLIRFNLAFLFDLSRR